MLLNKRKKKWLKYIPGLALIGLRTTVWYYRVILLSPWNRCRLIPTQYYTLTSLFFSFCLLVTIRRKLTAVSPLKQAIECFHVTSRRPYWCPKTMKRRPCWCPKPVLWELNSFLMRTLSFFPIFLFKYFFCRVRYCVTFIVAVGTLLFVIKLIIGKIFIVSR